MVLAPIYLGSLYARLDECIANVAWISGFYSVVYHVDSDFLQMFLWERSGDLARKHIGYSA